MKKRNLLHTLVFFLLMGTLSLCKLENKEPDAAPATAPSVVKLVQHNGHYQLTVNGEPFFVKGAGLEFGQIEALAQNGGNSMRTWRTQNGRQDALEVLDRAQANGLMVLMGLEVARERHGFDYKDTVAVQKQFEYLKGEVERLKHHPALLGWLIGNELNLEAKELDVYHAVNNISKMIHQIDPNHPTSTSTAGLGKRETDYIKEHCTDLDFLSVQFYADIENLQQRLAEAGWDGPYMVTEWGATGHWESPTKAWGASVEQTSQQKAEAFRKRYRMAIEADQQKCLGSYVFLWGQKQERTPTWYGMFLENGNPTETVDAMHYIWTGKWPQNRCPTTDSLLLNGMHALQNITLKPNHPIRATAYARDLNTNDSLSYHWELMSESTATAIGGDHENRPQSILKHNGLAELQINAPQTPGAYRLFVYVTDKGQKTATANIPFLVE